MYLFYNCYFGLCYYSIFFLKEKVNFNTCTPPPLNQKASIVVDAYNPDTHSLKS